MATRSSVAVVYAAIAGNLAIAATKFVAGAAVLIGVILAAVGLVLAYKCKGPS